LCGAILGGGGLTACTGRSIIGRRVEWDIGILFQARAIKVRHRSELVCARVNLVIHSLADGSEFGMKTNLIPAALEPAAYIACKPQCLTGIHTCIVLWCSLLVVVGASCLAGDSCVAVVIVAGDIARRVHASFPCRIPICREVCLAQRR